MFTLVSRRSSMEWPEAVHVLCKFCECGRGSYIYIYIPRVFVIHVNSAGHATSSLVRCGTMSEPTKRLFVRPAETCLFPFQSGFSPSVLANSMRPYICQNSWKRSMTGLNGWHSHSPHRSRNRVSSSLQELN